MGHEAVKADIVEHLTDHLGAWVAVVDVDGWPPVPELIAATDILPVDEDKPWPCLLVATTGMTPGRQPTAIAGDVFVGEYAVKITVAVRTSKSRDEADAAVGRDRLLQALRWLLLTSPAAGDSTTVLTAGWSEATDPVAVDPKGRMVALATVTFTARHTETVPDLAGYGTADAGVIAELAVTDADGSLFTNAEYDGYVAYDDTDTDYDGGTEWPPQTP